jgi:hypothetical protein
MELLAQRDGLEKWSKLIALTDAIDRARQGGELVIRSNGRSHRKYTPYQAKEIQHLEQQRKELRATMALKVVNG